MPALFIGGANSFIGKADSFVGGFAASGDVNVTLTGIALSTSQGALSYVFSKTVETQLLSLSQGSLGYAISKALVGNLINTSHGNLTPDSSLSLTGIALNTSQGALVYALSKTLDSQLLQLSQGAITATIGGNVNVTLTGIGMGLSQGSLTASITAASSGGKSAAHKKKRKPLQHRKQVEDLFGERFAELAGEIQDQLEVLPTEAIDAEISLLLKAKHYKQQLDSSNSKTSANELKRAYEAVNATIDYLKLVKQVNDDEEAMILIIYALYG